MAQNTTVDQSWGRLADAREEEREPQMLGRYTELVALSEEERKSRLLAMARAEYALPDDKLRTFTWSRLRVLLDMDPEAAKKVASSYDAVMNQMPGPAAMRRVGVVQTLAREFSPEDQERLHALVPRVFGGAVTAASAAAAAIRTAPVQPSPAKRPWWAFWKRR